MLTGKKYDEYLAGAIKEIHRVNKECPDFTYFDYQQFSTFPHKGDQIRYHTGLKLNEVKELAGLSIRTQRGKGSNNKFRGQGKRTERVCNIDECGKIFKALDDMRSCPACTNNKLYGDSYPTGLDEVGIGYL
jgi:hypothetical protein